MNNFLCNLSCTWMTIIDCLFYASDSLSWDVSWEYIAKFLVVWLYCIVEQWRLGQSLRCLHIQSINFKVEEDSDQNLGHYTS